ncbi:abortive infection family protein [Paenibacillus sp. WQ 127069]|uniref:Abortive infection family protein n=1 Tax=Paenibacillus baimaensis TaxID=2982185 RepID=A0ABT2UCU0_9BACL|nr:abortive infection family protein [Paenibacillus sp. WQ 127069]MCU6792412.1 abortive infection family protein [Paenibacillus sp. WQ 127069]
MESIITSENNIEEILNNLIESYEGKIINAFNRSFYNYEYCIEELCQYYHKYKELFNMENRFLELLRYSIICSGESSDDGYAYGGINKIKSNIKFLGEDLVLKLIELIGINTKLWDDRMKLKQMLAIINNSGFDDNKRRSLKFFYVDRFYLEYEINIIIKKEINSKYTEYVEAKLKMEEINKSVNIVFNKIHEKDSNKSIQFLIDYDKFSGANFIIKMDEKTTNSLMKIKLLENRDIIQILDMNMELLNIQFNEYDNCVSLIDKSLTEIHKFIKGKIDDIYGNKYLSKKIISNVLEKPKFTSLVVREALNDADSLIKANKVSNAVDRIHTALHGYLRTICEDEKILYEQDASIFKLLKLIEKNSDIFKVNGNENEHINRVLRSIGNIVDALNPIRNNASLAHPNDELLMEEEAFLVVNITLIILNYLDSKLVNRTKNM